MIAYYAIKTYSMYCFHRISREKISGIIKKKNKVIRLQKIGNVYICCETDDCILCFFLRSQLLFINFELLDYRGNYPSSLIENIKYNNIK